MTMQALFSADPAVQRSQLNALVLMGGGARTAYQAGVLQAIAQILREQKHSTHSNFPFQILVGTSAGALNAAYLASRAMLGLDAIDALSHFWTTLRSSQVYHLKVPSWIRSSRLMAALFLSQHVRSHQAFLDNTPLVNTLHRIISLPDIDQVLRAGVLHTLAVTASSYSSGVHWTFCQQADNEYAKGWNHPGRRSTFEPITIEHLIASSALPFIFPATSLWVEGRREFFGDGSMRQSSPLSAAIHLGAHKILVIGVGQPARAHLGDLASSEVSDKPSLGMIAGHALASIFQNTLQADVEQAQRVSTTLRQIPREISALMPYRPVDVLAISPSQSLDALAQIHAHELPTATYSALAGLSALGSRTSPGGAALASYLLFAPSYVQAVMALGEQDVQARKEEVLAFFTPGAQA